MNDGTMGFNPFKAISSLASQLTKVVKSVGEQIADEVSKLPSTIESVGKSLARSVKDGIRFISPITGELVKAFSVAEKFVLSPVGKVFDKTLVKWGVLPPNLVDALTNITAIPKRFATTGEFDRKELSKALRGATALAMAPSYGGIKRTSSYIASGKSKSGLVRTLDKYSGGIITATENIEDFAEKVAEQKTLKTMDWVTGGVGALKVAAAITTGGGSVTTSFITTGLVEKTDLEESAGGRALIMGIGAATGTATASAAGVIPPINTQQLFAKTIGEAVEAGASQATTKYLVRHTVLRNSTTGQILALSLGQSVGKAAKSLTESTVSAIANLDWDMFDANDALPSQAQAKEVAIKTAENAAAYEVAAELQKKGVNVSGQDLSSLSENIRKSSSKDSWQNRTMKEINKFVQEKLVDELQRVAAKEVSEKAYEELVSKIMAELDRLIVRLYAEAFDLISKYGSGMVIHLMQKYGLLSSYDKVVRPEDYVEYQITVNRINQKGGRLFSYNNYQQTSPLPYLGAGLLALLGTTYLVV
jgi:hypothetical protein